MDTEFFDKDIEYLQQISFYSWHIHITVRSNKTDRSLPNVRAIQLFKLGMM